MSLKFSNYTDYLVNNGFNVVNEYADGVKNIIFECKYNHKSDIKLSSFGNKKANTKNIKYLCATCKILEDNKVKLEQLKKKIKCKHNLVVYNNDKKIEYECHNCLSINSTTKGSLLHMSENSVCIKCLGSTQRKDYEELYDEVKTLGFELLTKKDKYKSNKDIKVICVCGEIWQKVSLNDLKRGRKCPNCKQDRTKVTNNKKYGVNNVFQNEDIKKKIVETSIEKYGVIHPSKNKDVQLKKEETCLKNNGVKWFFTKPEIYERIRKTHKLKYGCEYPLQSFEIQEKINNVFIEKIGVKRPMLSQYFRDLMLERYGNEVYCLSDDYKKKMLEHYGNECPMRCPELFRKASASSFMRKKYVYGEYEWMVLGYENRCLDILFNKYKKNPEDVFAGEDEEIPYFRYNCNECKSCKDSDEKLHIYYPDIYILNLKI